jgi:polyphosphate kinase
MNRNMLRRIELAWPVEDPVLRQRVIDECLTAYLQDGRNAWCMLENGLYQKIDKKGRYVRSAQAQWMAQYSAASTHRK